MKKKTLQETRRRDEENTHRTKYHIYLHIYFFTGDRICLFVCSYILIWSRGLFELQTHYRENVDLKTQFPKPTFFK